MPRHLRLTSLLTFFIFALVLSCTDRPASAVLVPADEFVPVALPPYRLVLVSPRVAPITTGLPEGMVMVLKSGTGRLNASSSIWKLLVDLAEDETVRAVVVADAPQGTAALFAELKELRPELLLLALSPVEAPLVIQAASDIVMDFDHIMRAYTAALVADRMGYRTLISLSVPGVDDDWRPNTRLAVLRMASTDMGLALKTFAVPPDGLVKVLTELGLETGAGSGKNSGLGSGLGTGTTGASRVAILVNDGGLASGALRTAEASGALFIELDRPEEGYAGIAANADYSGGTTSVITSVPASGDPVRALIDSARNVPGRPGLTLVWPGEQAALLESGALAFAKSIVDGKSASESGLATVMNGVWPAGQWHASHYVDPQTGVRARNHLLTGADPYLVGRSYLSSESAHLPLKYRLASW